MVKHQAVTMQPSTHDKLDHTHSESTIPVSWTVHGLKSKSFLFHFKLKHVLLQFGKGSINLYTIYIRAYKLEPIN